MKIYRIIDANINRLCEGLRVIEDFFRFFNNDLKNSENLKKIRHKVRKNTEKFDFINFRESEFDVGKDINLKEELKRDDIEHILKANFKRIEESLRVLEEYFKLFNENLSKIFKNIRFEIYEIEREIKFKKFKFLNMLSTQKPILYGIVDKRFSKLNHIDLTKQMLDGGIRIIQLREKILSDKKFLNIAIEMKNLCEEYDALFIVNDRVDIAILSNADGLHIGQDDIDINYAKNLLGPHKIYGLSTHNFKQVEDAITKNPDYIGFGPIFPTKSKENPDPIIGIDSLKRLKEEFKNSPPVVAIGGINLSNIIEVICCKPEMICVMSGIIGSNDVLNEVKKYLEIIDDTVRSC